MNIFKIIIAIFIIYLNLELRTIILSLEKIKKENNNNPYYNKDLNEKLLFMRHGETSYNADAVKDLIYCKLNPNYIDSKLDQSSKIKKRYFKFIIF